MISSVLIQVIPHKSQKYETAGNWEFIGSALKVSVSDTGDWKYNMAIAVHELVEAIACKVDGVKEEEVTNFDIQFEQNRAKGNKDEPGDEPSAPYQREHSLASGIERTLAAFLKIPWKEYEKAVNSL